MKKIIIAFVGLFSLAVTTQAQKKTGAIQFETTIDPAAAAAANGIQLSDEQKARMPKASKANFELLFTATSASYMPVEDAEDSNGNGGGGNGFGGGGGGAGRMMMRFGGAGGAREYYYTFADQKLVEVFDVSDTTYVMASKLQVAPPANLNFGGMNRQGGQGGQGGQGQNAQAPAAQSAVVYLPVPPTMEVVKTDETKKIIGFNCKKAIIKTIRKAKVLDMDKDIVEETAVWYTTELGFNFSPNPNMWPEGTVLAIENKGTTIVAKSIEYRGVSTKDVTAPKKALPITQEQYALKMQAMMKRFQNARQGMPGGTVRFNN